MLVGPPGAGKTTSLIKLALHYGVKARRPLHVISLDTLRVGGCDQLLRYTRVIGTNLRTVDHFSALESALSEHRTGLTLIDTPGFAPAEDADIEQLALAKRDLPMEVQLVLPAYTRLDTAERVVARFDALKPARLLLTHMDTAAGPGTAMELAMKTALPLSFFGIGQQIPEDLQEADKAALLAELIPRERAAASRAA
jgi:flagellar biosynthesis protein FlhF